MAKVEKLTHELGEVTYVFYCPGCGYDHPYRTARGSTTPDHAGVWTFTGGVDNPTFSPSLLVNAHAPEKRCHLFVRNGKIEFLADCWHDLKGQTVEMAEVE